MSTWAIAAIAVLAFVLAGVIYQSVGLARDRRRFPPPGSLIDVGGYRLHVVCRGHGGPTVVLESAIAASSVSWARVQPAVAQFTRVCAYDRAGLAWSDASTVPRSFARIVDELRTWLTTLGCTTPYVLVGHSFGVFVCLAYVARDPRHVGAIVLVDPPVEWMRMDQRQRRLLRGGEQLASLGGLLARMGVVRAGLTLLTGGAPTAPRHFVKVFGPTAAQTLERLVGEVRKLPRELHPIVQALWCQPKCFSSLADHLHMLPEAIATAGEVGSLGDVPLVVISSRDHTPDVTAAHHALARISSKARVLFAAKSGHWVPYDEPELIVEAIRDVIKTLGQTH